MFECLGGIHRNRKVNKENTKNPIAKVVKDMYENWKHKCCIN